MINYNNVSKLSNIKYNIIEFFNKHKGKIIVYGLIVVLSLLTGIFTGIKLYSYNDDLDIGDFSFESLTDGSIYTFRIFLLRYLSMLFLLLLIFILSMSFISSLFSYVLICYRSFLLALNCTLIIIFMGMPGLINGIIVIFPCQIINIAILILMHLICRSIFKEKKKCGLLDKHKLKKLLFLVLIALIINIVEIVLLLLFKATTILII